MAGLMAGFLGSLEFVSGGEQAHHAAEEVEVDRHKEVDLWTGRGVDLGGILFPHFNIVTVVGASTADEIEETLVTGHHDPNRDGVTVQGIELGLDLKLGGHLEGVAIHAAVIDTDDEWSGQWEELFFRWKGLPEGFEIRGGRYLNRLGFYNAVHVHGYPFVDKDLLEGRMLGEDGLRSEGGEITWLLPGLPYTLTSALSYSYGDLVFDDGHGHSETADESRFEAEGTPLVDGVHSAHWLTRWHYNDFHRVEGHLSAAWGRNRFEKEGAVYAGGVEYTWRENGFAEGGRTLRWRASVMYRDLEAVSGHLPGESEGEDADHHEYDHEHEEEAHEAQLSEWGVSTSLHYGLNDRWEAGLGAAWVEGIDSAGIDQRLRISPLLSFRPTENLALKLQYNFDRIANRREEHSVWLGLVFSWGGH